MVQMGLPAGMLLITRIAAEKFGARFVMPVMFIPSVGAAFRTARAGVQGTDGDSQQPQTISVGVCDGQLGNNVESGDRHPVNEFYQKGCQEKTSASTGGERFSRDPAHWN